MPSTAQLTDRHFSEEDVRKMRFASIPQEPFTEVMAAKRFVYLHGDTSRFCRALGWLDWNGVRWDRDDTGSVNRKVKDCIKRMYGLAAKIGEEDVRIKWVKFVASLETRAKIENILKIAESEESIAIRWQDLDRDPLLLNTLTGVVDLRTGELRGHNPKDLITKLAPVAYDQAATCPTYDQFVQSTFSCNEDMIAFTDRAIGHALTGVIVDAVIHILHGAGANGKSTIIELILHALGDYGMIAPPGLLIAKRHEQHPTELADLRGMRFVAATETGEGARFDEEKIKKLTGNDTIKGRYMHKDFMQFPPTHKLFVGTNHRPEIRGSDHAIWRRPKLWPFNVIFTEPTDPANPQPGEQDKRLLEKLKAEAPGILARWVRGGLEWQRIGLAPPEAVTAATADYRSECDRIEAFIVERCVVDRPNQSQTCKVNAGDLYAAYKSWAEAGNEFVMSQKRFGAAMTDKGFKRAEHPISRRKQYEGLGLLA